MFVSELQLEPTSVEFTPDKLQFQDGLESVLVELQVTAMRYQNLIADTYFDAFTRYDFLLVFCLGTTHSTPSKTW